MDNTLVHNGRKFERTDKGWNDKDSKSQVDSDLSDILEDLWVKKEIEYAKKNNKVKVTCPKCRDEHNVFISDLEKKETLCSSCQ
jgi:hypothetical protein